MIDDRLYLVDKSAHQQRYRFDLVARRLDQLIEAGQLAVCEVIALELLYSARSASDYEKLRTALTALPWLHVTTDVMSRALDVQRQLASRGQHRRPLPDLIIAATAELHDAVVLHYDRDFDLIADVTGQPTEWILPKESTDKSGQ
ncbi:MAG: PIN domain nuclease [Sciscionella sp.]|nr:PIN domain nuclease [Sciscionella sp.]